MSEEPRITRELRGHVLLIGLNRVKKKNAFDLDMLHQFSDAYAALEATPEARVGLVFAHGNDFTAGLDLASVAPVIAEGGKGLMREGATDPWGTFGPSRKKPLICAVQGLCLTMGIELILASDITVASSDTKFAQIEIKRGIFPFGGGTARWVSRCGWGNAMRYLLTADEFDAKEALRIGLVQEVVEKEQVLARALQLAETVAAQAPLGVQATLESARTAFHSGEEAAAHDLMPTLVKLMQTEDIQEGLASFMERRAAVFKGK